MSIVGDGMEAHTETIPTAIAVHAHTIMELGEVFLYTYNTTHLAQAFKYYEIIWEGPYRLR